MRRRFAAAADFFVAQPNRSRICTRSSITVEIARVIGHYAVQGHSRSLILVSIESP